MGYQESLIYFRRKNTILNQIENIRRKQKDNPTLNAYTVIQVIQSFVSIEGRRFRKGQIYLHIGGERSHQRTIHSVNARISLDKSKKIIPIESVTNTKIEFERHFKVIKTI